MAALTYVATINKRREVSVAVDTSDGIGSGVAAIIVDSTKSKADIWKAIEGIERRIRRDGLGASTPADFATSGTTLE